MVPVPAAAQTASSAIGAAVATSKCRPNINSGTATIVPPAPVNARIRPTTMPIAMLIAGSAAAAGEIGRHRNIHQLWIRQLQCLHQFDVLRACLAEIGRASCRERVCQNVSITVGAGSYKKKKKKEKKSYND